MAELECVLPHPFAPRKALLTRDSLVCVTSACDGKLRVWSVQARQCVAVLKGHADQADVKDCCFDVEGHLLCSCASDKQLLLWNMLTHQLQSTFKHARPVRTCCFSVDGVQIGSACDGDSILHIWDAHSQQHVATLANHTDQITCIAYSSNGRYWATSSFDGTVRIWSTDAGVRPAFILRGHTGRVHSCCFSPSSRYLVSTGDEGEAILWSIESMERVHTFEGHSGSILCSAFAMDDLLLATAGTDTTIRIWNVRSRFCLAVLEGHSNKITSISFSADRMFIVSASSDCTARLWRVSADLRSQWQALPPEVYHSVIEKDEAEDIVLGWIREGGKITARTLETQDSFLHAAAMANRSALVAELVRLGIEINTRNRHGHTPLYVAVEHDATESVRVLLELGANASSALGAARRSDRAHMLQLLAEYGGPSLFSNRQAHAAVDLILTQLKLQQYIPVLRAHEIDLDAFLLLSEEDLARLGISTIGSRRKMLSAAAEVRDRQQKTKLLNSNSSSAPPTLTEANLLPSPLLSSSSHTRSRSDSASDELSLPFQLNRLSTVSNSDGYAHLSRHTHTHTHTRTASLPQSLLQSPYIIDPHDLYIGEEVGRGAFGIVYKGEWHGVTVGIKKWFRPLSKDELSRFIREIEVISSLRCPFVTLFMGICVTSQDMYMITEYMAHGSLRQYLSSAPPLTPLQKVTMIFDVARGVNYLHCRSPPLIHRDISSFNVLVDHNTVCKLGDFGVSRPKLDTSQMTMQPGHLRWMAPEVMKRKSYDEKVDVYSFALIIWEIWSGSVPFPDMEPVHAAAAMAYHGERPNLLLDMPEPLTLLMEECWAEHPEDRPSFSTIVVRLQQLLVELLNAEPTDPYGRSTALLMPSPTTAFNTAGHYVTPEYSYNSVPPPIDNDADDAAERNTNRHEDASTATDRDGRQSSAPVIHTDAPRYSTEDDYVVLGSPVIDSHITLKFAASQRNRTGANSSSSSTASAETN